MIPLFHEGKRYYALPLSQNETKLFEGDENGLEELEVQGMPSSLDEAQKFRHAEKQLQFHTGTSGRAKSPAVYHGQGAGADDDGVRLEEFFRQVDQALTSFLQGERAPVFLAPVESHHSLYREVSSYSQLLEPGLIGSHDKVPVSRLQKDGWKVVRPHFEGAKRGVRDKFARLAGKGDPKASTKAVVIVPAARHGRVEALLVQAGARLWGRYDFSANRVTIDNSNEKGCEDLYDLAAIHTLLKGGEVHLLDAEEMPDVLAVAAVLRY